MKRPLTRSVLTAALSIVTLWALLLPWREAAIRDIDKLVLVCPGAEFIADLPHGKIPDRSDFNRMDHDARRRYWQVCIERSKALAEEFAELLAGGDPLRNATVFD